MPGLLSNYAVIEFNEIRDERKQIKNLLVKHSAQEEIPSFLKEMGPKLIKEEEEIKKDLRCRLFNATRDAPLTRDAATNRLRSDVQNREEEGGYRHQPTGHESTQSKKVKTAAHPVPQIFSSSKEAKPEQVRNGARRSVGPGLVAMPVECRPLFASVMLKKRVSISKESFIP
ncbi:hypothetical protein NDU88_004083 [Pleurodeles waltl]|uniref:Uncharacterized protein n=1 Tax=Pleurodeles waltl TaxID=8319 RepID=A0AAV7QBW7_PLEWA|nr:hypothetical protein NDU88_004083 [Pleurodeles waltl]